MTSVLPERFNSTSAPRVAVGHTAQDAVQPWYMTACLTCEFGEHTPRPSERCPYDGSILLRMEGLVSAWDVVTVARSIVKASRARFSTQAAAQKVTVANNQLRSRVEGILSRS